MSYKKQIDIASKVGELLVGMTGKTLSKDEQDDMFKDVFEQTLRLMSRFTSDVVEAMYDSTENWDEFLELIKERFTSKKNDLAFIKPNSGEIDANFTLGWKLEVTNKERTLSSPLKLTNNEIVKIIFKGENQTLEKKDAVIFSNTIQKNSGIAEYLINGNIDKYSNAQDVIDDLINLDTYDAGDIYLVFTANNFRYKANKADGARTLAIAVKWSVKNNRLSPEIIFDEPLIYQGERDMMPLIKQCLIQLKINDFSDIDIEKIKPNAD